MLSKKKKRVDSNLLIEQEMDFIMNKDTNFFIREAYNTLRSNVNFSLTDEGCKLIGITSTNPSEGKSLTALNLAIAFSEVDKKTLLIDGDLRKPKVHRLLKVDAKPGLSNLLIKECEVDEVIKRSEEHGIDVICSGDIPPNSTKLLESPRFESLLEELKARYDIIIIDTPPVNIVVDASLIAKLISGMIFIVKQDYAKKDNIVNAVKQIEYAKGKIIGFVLNNITDKSFINFSRGYKYKKYKYEKYGYKTARSHDEDDATEEVDDDTENLVVGSSEEVEAQEQIPEKAESAKDGEGEHHHHHSHSEGEHHHHHSHSDDGHHHHHHHHHHSHRREREKKKKLKILLISLLSFMIVIVGAFGILAYNQRETIEAITLSRNYTPEELEKMAKDIEADTQEVVSKLDGVDVMQLTDEQRELLKEGKITKKEAIDIITRKNEQKVDANGQVIEKPKERIPDKTKTVANIYLLKAEFLNKIDALIAQGIAEAKAIPKEDRSLTTRLNLATKYAGIGSGLEADCDGRMEALLDELRMELGDSGDTEAVVNNIRSLYSQEKKLKKAQLVDAYWPK